MPGVTPAGVISLMTVLHRVRRQNNSKNNDVSNDVNDAAVNADSNIGNHTNNINNMNNTQVMVDNTIDDDVSDDRETDAKIILKSRDNINSTTADSATPPITSTLPDKSKETNSMSERIAAKVKARMAAIESDLDKETLKATGRSSRQLKEKAADSTSNIDSTSKGASTPSDPFSQACACLFRHGLTKGEVDLLSSIVKGETNEWRAMIEYWQQEAERGRKALSETMIEMLSQQQQPQMQETETPPTGWNENVISEVLVKVQTIQRIRKEIHNHNQIIKYLDGVKQGTIKPKPSRTAKRNSDQESLAMAINGDDESKMSKTNDTIGEIVLPEIPDISHIDQDALSRDVASLGLFGDETASNSEIGHAVMLIAGEERVTPRLYAHIAKLIRYVRVKREMGIWLAEQQRMKRRGKLALDANDDETAAAKAEILRMSRL